MFDDWLAGKNLILIHTSAWNTSGRSGFGRRVWDVKLELRARVRAWFLPPLFFGEGLLLSGE